MYNCVRVVILLTILILKVCSTQGKSVQVDKNKAAPKAHNLTKAHDNAVTSYYRHDPFGPHTYAFGYEVNDNATGNVQFRDERRYINGSVEGSYGFVRRDGRITVTHFLSDNERGYLSHTDTFNANEQHKWQENWPTRKPNILMQHPEDAANHTNSNIIYDADKHLNMTQAHIAESLVDSMKENHNVDLQKVDLEEDIINPAISDIVNGKIPLQQQAANSGISLGFETVQDFIPSKFPIVPFTLPVKNENMQDQAQSNDPNSKYDRAKSNNAEKSIPQLSSLQHHNNSKDSFNHKFFEHLDSNQKNTPKPLTLIEKEAHSGQAWYEKVINETRKEFLENLPNL